MIKTGGDFKLTNKAGATYWFSGPPQGSLEKQMLTRRIDPDGHRLDYTYVDNNGYAALDHIVSNRGYALVLEPGGNGTTVCGYNLAKQALPSNCSSSVMKIIYGSDNSITDPEGHITYRKSLGADTTCITVPDDYDTCSLTTTYAPSTLGTIAKRDQVIRQVTATGEVWEFAHEPVPDFDPGDYQTYPENVLESYAYITAPSTFATYARFGNGELLEITTPDTGKQEYEYASPLTFRVTYRDHYNIIDYSRYPSKISYPEGNSIRFVRDFADNVVARTEVPKPGSGEASRTVSWQYPYANKWSSPTICTATDVLCDKVFRITDYKGNETDFEYNSVYGGLLSKTLPADANGVRPQTRYVYSKKYAWTKSGSGYVQQPVGIWVLVKEEYCRTSAATNVTVNANSVTADCAAGASDEVVTTYEYEAGDATKGSNLLLLGTAVTSEGETLRSCVVYDDLSRKIAETKPAADLGSCQ